MDFMIKASKILLFLVLITSITGYAHAAITDLSIEQTLHDDKIDQLLADSKEKGTPLRVALYPGSFDPFHIGHLEACVQSLPYVDYVIVAPNNPNNGKPFRAELEDRYKMIQLSTKDHPRIIVTQESINSLDERLNKDATVVGLLGSDQYGNLVKANKKPKMKAHEWIIIPREGYDVELKDDWNKPIQLLSKDLFKDQNWSSTYIRNKLLEKDYTDLPLVNKEVETYLDQNDLYSPKGHSERVVRKLYPAAEGFTYLKENVMLSSDKKLIVKVFRELNRYQQELKALHVLNSLNSKLPTPSIVFSKDLKNGYYLLGMSYEGESVEQQIKQGQSAYTLCKAVGGLLKQLHTSTQSVLNQDQLNQLGKVKKILHKVDDALIQDFLRNPGVGGYTHGDASISNFVVNPTKDEAKLIDFAGVAKYGDQGIPAYEYYQFLSSLEWKLKDKEVIEAGKQGFMEGYGEPGFTQEADTLMRTYWEKASS